MIQRVELLVHAGAPSSRKDDNRYSAQAEAYIAFRGRRTLVSQDPEQPMLAAQSLDGDDGCSGGNGAGSTEQQHDIDVIDSPTFIDDTQLAITGLESQLLTSSIPLGPRERAGSTNADRSLIKHLPSSPPRALEGLDDASLSKDDLLAQIRSFGKRKRDDGSGVVEGPGRCREGRPPSVDETAAEDLEQDAVPSSDYSFSSYLKTPVLDRSIKKRRIGDTRERAERQARIFQSHGHVGGNLLVDDQSSARRDLCAPPATAPPVAKRSQHPLTVSEPTSELPTSYSLSDITSASSRALASRLQRSASASSAGGQAHASLPGHVDSSTDASSNVLQDSHPAPTVISRESAPQQAQPAPEVIIIADDTPTDGKAAEPGVSAITNPAARSRTDALDRAAVTPTAPTPVPSKRLSALEQLSKSIHPPEPEISVDAFKTHITPDLARLAASPDMAGRYNPVSVTRDLRILERGHWIFDTSTIGHDRQLQLWQFLEAAIGKGGQGWGIWCERENGARDGLGVVRVWCWGEVVKHVYLLLYVASSSQIRKLGAKWVDAEGIEVVKMREWAG